jgi:hypothetical protein
MPFPNDLAIKYIGRQFPPDSFGPAATLADQSHTAANEPLDSRDLNVRPSTLRDYLFPA